ncbi:MAG: methyltransferase domain-containing protein [Pseudomonadota bacterium]
MILTVNDDRIDLTSYDGFHAARFDRTLALVRALGGGRTVELGGHPWALTARLLAEPSVNLLATVSAEEVTAWPDEIPVVRHSYRLVDGTGTEHHYTNVSANLERTRFALFEDRAAAADLVLACEIIEHLTRAPHTMMLNINSWLKLGGLVVLTTPNGAQFNNPLRIKPKMPAYRFSNYARHNFVFTMDLLTDLMETCGFKVESANYWSPYARSGGAKLYKRMAELPGRYFKDKFGQSLVVVARKAEDRDTASRRPKAYAPSPHWEDIDDIANSAVAPQLELEP